MTKTARNTVVRIGQYEVHDARLSLSASHPEKPSTLSIPCDSDPELCMQLDGWDEHTSVPAYLDGEHGLLYRQHYDQQENAWVLRLA